MEYEKGAAERKTMLAAILEYRTVPRLLKALYCILPGLMSLLLALGLGEVMPLRIMTLLVWGAYVAMISVVMYRVADVMSRDSCDVAADHNELMDLFASLVPVFLGMIIATVAASMAW